MKAGVSDLGEVLLPQLSATLDSFSPPRTNTVLSSQHLQTCQDRWLVKPQSLQGSKALGKLFLFRLHTKGECNYHHKRKR